jgi:ATP-dependent Clp protease protease subunit
MLKSNRILTLSCLAAASAATALQLTQTGTARAEGEAPVIAANTATAPQRGHDLAKLEPKEIAGAAAAAATAAVEEITNQQEENPHAAAAASAAAAAAGVPVPGQAAVPTDPNGVPIPPEQPVPVEYTDEMKKLAQDRLKLELQYSLRIQELRNQLADLEIERQRLDTEMTLSNTRQAKELLKVEQEKRRLQGENLMEREKLNQQALTLTAQREKLEAETALQKQEVAKQVAALEAETLKLQSEKAKLAADQELLAIRNQSQIAEVLAQKEKLEADLALSQTKVLKELESMRQDKDRIAAQLETLQQRVALAEAQTNEAVVMEKLVKSPEYKDYLATKKLFEARGEARTAEMAALETEAKLRQTQVDAEIALMTKEIGREEQRKVYDEFVINDIEYKKEPFRDGILYVTDRRIPMNDVIMMPTADYVTSMIDYFNNKSPEYPIFLVIDDCPGGSVMAGYRILKAMQGSKAPVYVVVKSYAASMAATICTMAPRSYVYPNAIIHHHQMLYGYQGNMTQQADALAEAKRWWERLAGPVAGKMGTSLDEFTKRMYSKNADGEWAEFGTEAVKLKWADTVVEEIREVGTSKMPDQALPPILPWFALKEQKDDKGKTFKALPRLGRFDAWYLNNKDSYYRFE